MARAEGRGQRSVNTNIFFYYEKRPAVDCDRLRVNSRSRSTWGGADCRLKTALPWVQHCYFCAVASLGGTGVFNFGNAKEHGVIVDCALKAKRGFL